MMAAGAKYARDIDVRRCRDVHGARIIADEAITVSEQGCHLRDARLADHIDDFTGEIRFELRA